MSVDSYWSLIHILYPFLYQKAHKSHGPEPILIENIVTIGLHVLSCGWPKNQRNIIGMCPHAPYKLFNDFLDDASQAPESKCLVFPNSGIQHISSSNERVQIKL